MCIGSLNFDKRYESVINLKLFVHVKIIFFYNCIYIYIFFLKIVSFIFGVELLEFWMVKMGSPLKKLPVTVCTDSIIQWWASCRL